MSDSRFRHLEAAERAIAKGQPERALAEYSQILTEVPGDIEVLALTAELLSRMGQRLEAAENYYRLGVGLTSGGFALRAVGAFKSALACDPELIDAHRLLAQLFGEMGMVADAKSHLMVLADFLDRHGQAGQSLEVYRHLVALEPDEVGHRVRLAELLSTQNNQREAVEHLRKAAGLLSAKGRLDEYLRVLERLSYFDQQDTDLLKELANIYLQIGRNKEALKKLQSVYTLAPDDLQALEMMTTAFIQIEQPIKAIQVYKMIAALHLQLQEPELALQAYRRILEIDPEEPEARRYLGR